jgi:hypothetical protein
LHPVTQLADVLLLRSPPPPPKKPSPPLNNTQAKDVYAQVRQVLEDVQEARQNPDVDQVVSKQSTSKLLL